MKRFVFTEKIYRYQDIIRFNVMARDIVWLAYQMLYLEVLLVKYLFFRITLHRLTNIRTGNR